MTGGVWWLRSLEGHVLLPKAETRPEHLQALVARGEVVDAVAQDGLGAEVACWLPRLRRGELIASSARWLHLAEEMAQRHGVWLPLVLAVIHAESRGNPDEMAADGGVGLMQITHASLKAGHTDEQLCDPRLNLDIGVGYLGRIDRWTVEVPEIASCYNAGGEPYEVVGSGGEKVKRVRPWRSTESFWGLREAFAMQRGLRLGYIDGVVLGVNAAIDWLADAVCAAASEATKKGAAE